MSTSFELGLERDDVGSAIRCAIDQGSFWIAGQENLEPVWADVKLKLVGTHDDLFED